MARFPMLPLFTGSYLADTPNLELDEHGAYLLLMMLAWQRPGCTLPNDEQWIRKAIHAHGKTWKRLRETVLHRFWQQRADGEWEQKRLTKEWRIAEQKSERARAKATKRWADESHLDRFHTDFRSDSHRVCDSAESVNQGSTSNKNNDIPNAAAMPRHATADASIPIPIKRDSESVESLFPTENQNGAQTRPDVSREAKRPNGGADDPSKKLYDLGAEILGRGQGGLITKLLKAKGGNYDLAMGVLYTAKPKSNPREYIGAVIRGNEPKDDEVPWFKRTFQHGQL